MEDEGGGRKRASLLRVLDEKMSMNQTHLISYRYLEPIRYN